MPLCRYGEPEEFGGAAAFVFFPAAFRRTGAMIPVDGGAISSIWPPGRGQSRQDQGAGTKVPGI
jgi:hypothetical protein